MGPANLLQLLLLLLLLLLAQGGEGRQRHSKPRCSKCAPGWGVASACVGVARPTRCVACVRGRSYSPHNSFHAPCWLCSRCGPGLFEARACTSVSDTVCDACARVSSDLSALRPRDYYLKCANDTAKGSAKHFHVPATYQK